MQAEIVKDFLPNVEQIEIVHKAPSFIVVRVTDHDRNNLVRPGLADYVIKRVTEEFGYQIKAFDYFSAIYPIDKEGKPIIVAGVIPEAFSIELKLFV